MKPGERGVSPVLILAVVIVALGGIAGAAIVSLGPGARRQGGSTQPGGQSGATHLCLETIESVDQERTDLEAFSILVPSGWQFRGGISWRTDRPLLPASLEFSVTGPGGLKLEVFRDEAYFWVEGLGLLVPYDYGPELRAQYAQDYQGYGMSLPLSASEYIREVLIPEYRPDASDLQIVSTASLNESDLVQQLENMMSQRPQGPFPEEVTVDAAGILASYVENGRSVEEEFWAIILVDTFRTTTEMEQMTGVRLTSTFWYTCGLWSIRGEEELTAENARVLMCLLNSFRWNQEWLDEYSSMLVDLWQRFLEGIMERHQAIVQAQNEVTRVLSTTFSSQEAAMERISESWSQVIRGVERYDPSPGLVEFSTGDQPSVELPNGYEYAWTNRLGDYLLTNSSLFNPNVDLETGYQWTPMTKRQ